jgi:hypothetical protein
METLLKVELKQHFYIFSIIVIYIFLKIKVDEPLHPSVKARKSQKRDSSVAIRSLDR